MKFEDLTPEQQAKAEECKTTEEILAFVRDEGIELDEDELDGIAGGWEHKKRGPIGK